MSTREEDLQQILYINPDIKRFSNVNDIADYTKIKSRRRESQASEAGRRHRGNLIKRLRSWSRSDKIALSIAVIGLIALAATIVTLLVVAGLVVI